MQRFRLPLMIGFLVTLFAIVCGVGVNQGLSTFVLALPDDADLASLDGAGPAEAASDDSSSEAQPARRSKPKGPSKSSYVNGILARNIFDSTAVGKVAEGGGGEGDTSDLKVSLMATLVATPASFSSAYIVRDGVAGSGADYGIGDTILGAEIIAIAKTEVKIRRPDGDEEYIRFAQDDEKKPASKASTSGNDDDDISKDGDNKFTVSRDLVDRHLNNLEGISRLGRAIPHRGSDGEIDGYRLSGIRRGTVGEKLGIRNGDIVHRVNGYELNSMSEAMKAFQELQNEDAFNFELTRRGKKQTMEYDVR